MAGHKQTTDGVGYETGYVYNLSGAMVEQRYPGGRVVKNVLDDNGDLSMVQSARCLDSTPGTNAACTAQAGLWNYARHFTYNAAGAVTSMQLGNGRWESTVFNSRLQPVQIALGATGTGISQNRRPDTKFLSERRQKSFPNCRKPFPNRRKPFPNCRKPFPKCPNLLPILNEFKTE